MRGFLRSSIRQLLKVRSLQRNTGHRLTFFAVIAATWEARQAWRMPTVGALRRDRDDPAEGPLHAP